MSASSTAVSKHTANNPAAPERLNTLACLQRLSASSEAHDVSSQFLVCDNLVERCH
jgi:hypothetical protein